MQRRHYGFCWTLNNWTEADIASIKNIECRYMVFGYEIGESGTPHLQGYLHFKKQLRFSTVKGLIPRAHIEERKGTVEQAAAYCKKDGEFWESGSLPMSPVEKGEKSKEIWAEILKRAEDGDHEWIRREYPKVWINMSNRLENLRRPNTSILDGDLTHEWWYGATGTGKSRHVWELYPDHFQKELNKWWCGYRGEDVVVIEEWSPKNECTGSQLKIWADRYPFTGQIKGGSLKKIRPVKIIVLSNYTIEQCFNQTEDSQPLLRRFRQFQFPQDLPWVRSAAAFHHELSNSTPTSSDQQEDGNDQDTQMPEAPTAQVAEANSTATSFTTQDWDEYRDSVALESLLSLDDGL